MFQPVFLTKEQRAQEALKRRQEEVEAKRKQQDEERKLLQIAKSKYEETNAKDDHTSRYIHTN